MMADPDGFPRFRDETWRLNGIDLGAKSYGLVWDDVNGDGRPDLFDPDDRGHVTILRGTAETGFLSTDRFAFREVLFRERLPVSGPALIADLDGDGASDAVMRGEGRIIVLRGAP